MSEPRVFDCFTFFNELDLLEIRLAELEPMVDHFVLVESTRTFTGNPKPLYYADNQDRYRRFAHKIIHVVVEDLPLDASTHWDRETFQRNAIMRGLTEAKPDDRIIISDCDEIPKPDLLRWTLDGPCLSRRIIAFWCDNYFYRLNLRNDAHDHRLGPRLLTMSNLRSPQEIRQMPFRFSRRTYLRPFASVVAGYRITRRLRKITWATILWSGAWHFTCMGGLESVVLKFASFSHADDGAHISAAAYEQHISQLERRPLAELPFNAQHPKFAGLLEA